MKKQVYESIYGLQAGPTRWGMSGHRHDTARLMVIGLCLSFVSGQRPDMARSVFILCRVTPTKARARAEPTHPVDRV
jgi:hypothetical protein